MSAHVRAAADGHVYTYIPVCSVCRLCRLNISLTKADLFETVWRLPVHACSLSDSRQSIEVHFVQLL